MDDVPAGGHSAATAAREIAEFSAFYRANVPRLVAFLVCQGASVVDAADCVQDTLVDALPPVWSTLMSPYSWCRSVAYRKLQGHWSRGVLPVRDPELAGALLIAPDHDLDLFEHHQDFRYWLEQLTAEKQRAVLVCTYDGASSAEIADLLAMTPATVRSTLRNAREALRRARDQQPSGGERRER